MPANSENPPRTESGSSGGSRKRRVRRLTVAVQPELIRWARERAGLSLESLEKTLPKIRDWEAGRAWPTLRQLESFAKKVRVPFGFMFLPQPPEERLPVRDFRTGVARAGFPRPSPDLLEVIYLCQQRQDWYRDYQQLQGEDPLGFVGSASVEDDPLEVAAEIRRRLGFDVEARAQIPTWWEALRQFRAQVESIGVLVMSSSIVGNNTRRKLNLEEFRGFALVDRFAPLIFVNTADSKSGQMFTIAHELAHVWAGASGVSDARVDAFPEDAFEKWCNQVAAELLVPLEVLREEYDSAREIHTELRRLARTFKVSTLVVLRRLYEAGAIDAEAFSTVYAQELQYLREVEKRTGQGGDFYATLAVRVSPRFARALVASTLEGITLFRDAYRLLGVRNPETFHRLAKDLSFEVP